MHLGINMLTLAALGAGRAAAGRAPLRFLLSLWRRRGRPRHILVYPDSPDPVVGASGSISGVFGAC